MALALKTAVTATQTTIDVTGSDVLEEGDIRQIDSEQVMIRRAVPATLAYLEPAYQRLTVYRGVAGTTKATHAAAASLSTPSAGGGGGVTVDNLSDPPAEVTTIVAPGASISDGEATFTPVVISDSDPGAIGSGFLWLNTAQDAFDDLVNFPLLVRNEANDGWLPVMGDAIGSINLSGYSADGTLSSNLQLRTFGTTVHANLVMFGADGQTGVAMTDNGTDPAVALVRVGGVTIMSLRSDGQVLMPELPTSDPGVADQLWNDAGILKVSAG